MNDSSITNPAYRSLTDQQLAEIDELCERFDRELVNGGGPRIETYLATASAAIRDELLAELLAVELEYRAQRGDGPRAEEYHRRFPQQEAAVANVFSGYAETENLGQETLSNPANVPAALSNFRLIEVIGRGGMGVVWLAEQDKPVKRRVALKMIKSELAAKDVVARFESEKQALAMMDHPNIAHVLDAGNTSDGRPYFVMELIEGIPITRYCDDNKLNVDERLKLFVPVCKAVQHAHQKGIVHRDLKPSNVLVALVDGEAIPKIIDFGLAKAVASSMRLTDMTIQTECGKIIGTMQYMSPEQASLNEADAQNIDTQTDVYSLGVMLYELLTGSTPLDRETLQRNSLLKVLQLIREEDPIRPSQRLSSSSQEEKSAISRLRRTDPGSLQRLLRGELDWVAMKALEKDRSRRYSTANDLAQDLSGYLTGETVAARPPSTWYQVQKFARRNRGLVAAVLAIGVVLIAGILGTSYGLFRATEKTKLANDKTREANEERGKAIDSEQRALSEKANAQSNEQRAIEAEKRAIAEAQRARDAEVGAKFQLAIARWDAGRAQEARSLLHQIPQEYRDNFEWHYCNRRFQGSDITCYGHSRDVYEVAFTPDGKRVVSAGRGGTIRLWDAATGQQLGTLKGHEGQVLGLAVSPDGSFIASAGIDRIVRLWDAQSGEIVRTMSGHAGTISGLAFSPCGDRIATSSADKAVKVWDTQTGKELITASGHTAAVSGVAFSPDGTHLASTSSEDQTVRIWDSRNGKQLKIVRPGWPEIRRLAFSPDGARLAAVYYGKYAQWDTRTWERVAEVVAHNRRVLCVAFSPDGSQFATAGVSTEIKLWDTRTGKLINTLSGHSQMVWGVAFSPDGSRLVSAGADRTVKIWNTHGHNDLTLRGHSEHVYCVAFSKDGRQLATGSESVILRDAQTGDVKFRLNGHMADIAEVSFSPDGTRLASAADDHTVRLWNTETGEEVAVLKGHTYWVSGVAYSPDGKRLASSSRDGTIKLWDAQEFKETATLQGHRGVVYCVAFSPDGSCLASASMDQTVKLWDVATGKEIRTFTGHTALVRKVAFDKSGKRIVSGGYDTKIRVFDVASGEQIATAHTSSAVFGLTFHPDGKRFVACGTNGTIQLFDALTGQEIMALFLDEEGASSIAFSPDGTRLAAGVAEKGILRIFEAPQKREAAILSGHSETVTSVTFSVDGSRIYSKSENEKLVWNAETRKTIPDALWEPAEKPIHTSPDQRWFVTAESNNVVLVDLEYKNAPDEKARRVFQAKFDPLWHQARAEAASKAEHWCEAVFHFSWLVKHDSKEPSFQAGLHSSCQRLKSQFGIAMGKELFLRFSR